MFPQSFAPKDQTSILVEKYISMKHPTESNGVCDKFIPDGHSAFVFHFGQLVKYNINGTGTELPRFFITKPFLGHLNIEVVEPNDCLIVILNSSVLTRLFNFSFEDSVGSSHIVINLFGDFPLWSYLKEADSFEDKIDVFSRYLNDTVLHSGYEPDLIDKIYDEIMHDGGIKPINTILDKFEVNPRSFRRNFIKRVGITAKGLSRIVRVNYFWGKIQTLRENDLHNFIFECNYCDQSHFIKDFKEIIGETPKSFFKRDLSAVKLVSGKKIMSII